MSSAGDEPELADRLGERLHRAGALEQHPGGAVQCDQRDGDDGEALGLVLVVVGKHTSFGREIPFLPDDVNFRRPTPRYPTLVQPSKQGVCFEVALSLSSGYCVIVINWVP